jgi:hypothetical protein
MISLKDGINLWVRKNDCFSSTLKKLITNWTYIIEDSRVMRFSVPKKIQKENNQIVLIINVYSSASTIRLQSQIEHIKRKISSYFDYKLIDNIRIIHKSPIDLASNLRYGKEINRYNALDKILY